MKAPNLLFREFGDVEWNRIDSQAHDNIISESIAESGIAHVANSLRRLMDGEVILTTDGQYEVRTAD